MSELRPTFAETAQAEELIHAWLEQKLDEAGAQELLRLITEFPRLGDRAVNHLQMNQMLRDLLGETPARQPVAALHLSESDNRARLPSGWSRRTRLSVVTAGACLVALTAGWWGLDAVPGPGAEQGGEEASVVTQTQTVQPQVLPDPQLETMTDAVALVSRSLSVEVPPEGRALDDGSVLSPGPYVLEKGVCNVDFFNGTRVAIQSPCVFEILSGSRIRCQSGKMFVTLPGAVRDFRIETPHGEVAEVSEQLGVDVSEAATEIHNFQGQAKLRGFSGLRVRAGEAYTFTAQQIQKVSKVAPARFLSVRQIDESYAAALAARQKSWREYADQMNQDPSLVVRFELSDSDSVAERILLNQARHSHVAAGSIVGCQTSGGRWNDPQALVFQSLTDRVCLDVPDQYNAVTLTAWVRLRAFPEKFAGLVMTDGNPVGGVHWQITRERGIRICSLTPPGKWNRLCDMETPSILTQEMLGKWLHLAVVLDSVNQSAAHYLNGELVKDGPLLIEQGISLGQASLGNWSRPGNHHSPIRNLQGDLREVTIHSRALGPQEIKTIYTSSSLGSLPAPSLEESAAKTRTESPSGRNIELRGGTSMNKSSSQ